MNQNFIMILTAFYLLNIHIQKTQPTFLGITLNVQNLAPFKFTCIYPFYVWISSLRVVVGEEFRKHSYYSSLLSIFLLSLYLRAISRFKYLGLEELRHVALDNLSSSEISVVQICTCYVRISSPSVCVGEEFCKLFITPRFCPNILAKFLLFALDRF